jgi:MtN3 and saliva related transmembrane protein
MLAYDVVGFIAGFFTSLSLLPQVLRVRKLKSAREISLPFTFGYVAGGALWLAYGIVLSLPPVIFWNCVSLVLTIALVCLKVKYGR